MLTEDEKSLLAEYAILTTRYTKENCDNETRSNIRERQKEIEGILNLNSREIGVKLLNIYQSSSKK